MPRWMWSLLVLVAVLVLFKRIILMLILGRLRLRPVGYQALAGSEVETWERELLQGAEGLMSSQGFRFSGYARLPDPMGMFGGRAMAFFEHEAEPVWASVGASDIPFPQCPFQINYVTCFTNGRLLHTSFTKERIFPYGVDYAVEHHVPAADFSALFAAHGEASAEMGRAARAERIGFAALLFLGDKLMADQLDSLADRGLLVPAGDGAYRLTLRGLWTANRETTATAPAAAKVRQVLAARRETFPLPPEAEADAFLRIDAMGPRMGNYGKGLLILASLAAFSLLSGGGFAWASGAMLLAIVFIHEMGHALAMRWVGYRDVSVFFIPFFGAVAIGRQERQPAPWKEALILLAGPVPGLAVGLAVLAGGGDFPAWVHQAALTSVIVNGFNLLPIAPLDGGQLMQLILFRRFPRLNKVFLVLSAVAVGGLAWWSESPLLGFFAMLLLWGIYKSGQREQGQAELAAIRARYGDGRDAAGKWNAGMVAEFFAFLRHGNPSQFTDKLARIKGFLTGPADGLPARPAGALTALSVFALYACFLLAPLAWYAAPMLGGFSQRSKTIERADLEPAQARIYDSLCMDSAVYQIGLFSMRDTLYLHASIISPGDSARVDAMAKALVGREAMRVSVMSPIWRLGGLDSTLEKEMRGGGAPDDEESYGYDSARTARYMALDSAGQAAWEDSADRAQAVLGLRLDSLQKVEAAIWESWTADRRKAWLADWIKERIRNGGSPPGCFKG